MDKLKAVFSSKKEKQEPSQSQPSFFSHSGVGFLPTGKKDGPDKYETFTKKDLERIDSSASCNVM